MTPVYSAIWAAITERARSILLSKRKDLPNLARISAVIEHGEFRTGAGYASQD